MESRDAAPALTLPEGTYIVHASLDLASAVRRVTVSSKASSERMILNAGALRVVGVLGDQPINPAKMSIAIYVPKRDNSEAKLVRPRQGGRSIGLPEGNYHVVSTLLDTAGYSGAQQSGVGNKTNSVISADLKVQAGKLTDATLRHRSAVDDPETGEHARRRSPRQYVLHNSDARRRRHPRNDRGLPLARPRRRRICRHRPA